MSTMRREGEEYSHLKVKNYNNRHRPKWAVETDSLKQKPQFSVVFESSYMRFSLPYPDVGIKTFRVRWEKFWFWQLTTQLLKWYWMKNSMNSIITMLHFITAQHATPENCVITESPQNTRNKFKFCENTTHAGICKSMAETQAVYPSSI